MKELYTVSKMAAICNISVQGLRYYDKIGLLKPAMQDPSTGYRYYTNREVHILRILQDMKKMGFSLEEIQRCLQTEDRTQLVKELNDKKQEIEQAIEEYQKILELINNRIENYTLSMQDRFFFENSIEIKQLSDRTVYYTRYFSNGAHEELVLRFYELDRMAERDGVKPEGYRIAIYHDFLQNFDINRCDLEVCNEIIAYDPDQKRDNIRIIPGGLYATAFYSGPYQGQCMALANWLEEHGYTIIGPGIEIYHNSFMNTLFPKNYITQIQFPIQKNKKKGLTL
jgi:DNA-binding transcriptional MerR regulator/effector-binding domain-containing protein